MTAVPIVVHSLKLGDFFIDAPVGLSELLRTTWVTDRTPSKYSAEYKRTVLQVDGRIVTRLSKL